MKHLFQQCLKVPQLYIYLFEEPEKLWKYDMIPIASILTMTVENNKTYEYKQTDLKLDKAWLSYG